MNEQKYEELLGNSLIDKAVLRHELRRLPIEDKLKVIAFMQRRSNAIRRSTGRSTTPEWSWAAVGLTPGSPPPRAGSLLAKLGIYEYAQAEQRATDQFDSSGAAISEHHPGVTATIQRLEAATFVTDYLSQFDDAAPKYVDQFSITGTFFENQTSTKASLDE